jgi:4Fe-4S ferredoxin
MSEAIPEECKKEPGLLAPVIDRNRCEGKADCEEVCPYDVFDIGVLPEAERASLSFGGRIKSFFHGYKQAFAVRAADCHACGLCVAACPEKAIKLARPEKTA